MKFLKINGKNVSVPTSYKDVTWGQFKKISTLPTKKDVIEYLIGDSLAKYKGVESFNLILSSLKFLSDIPTKSTKPKIVRFHGQEVLINDDLENLTFGQYWDMLNIASSDSDIIPEELVAIYFQPKLFGASGYDYEVAAKLMVYVKNLPCEVVLTLTDFFLQSLTASGGGMKVRRLRLNTIASKCKQVMRTWTDSVLVILYRSWLRISGLARRLYSAK